MSARRILVTGAASGIGAALTGLLRQNGDEVVSIDRNEAAGINACDLSDPKAIASFCDKFSDPLDAIAHVAGLPGTYPPSDIIKVNFCAVRQLTEGLAAKMPEHSAMVAVSSITAHRCTLDEKTLHTLASASDKEILAAGKKMDGTEAYAFSKRLLNIWIENMASTTRETGLRANAVAPGPVETPILSDFRDSMGSDKLAKAAQLVGRHGRPDEIAAAAAFLLSADASWINGVVLDCDGGFNAARRAAARNISDHSVEQEHA